MKFHYSSSIANFLDEPKESIVGKLSHVSQFDVSIPQRNAWESQIDILQETLKGLDGSIFFEFIVPRMGHRIDVALIISSVLFVVEFKVGSEDFDSNAIDQVWDYGLDLKNFHEHSHKATVLPILVSTGVTKRTAPYPFIVAEDNLLSPICASPPDIRPVIDEALDRFDGTGIDPETWEAGRYQPTPTIIEAAQALYGGHKVEEISRRDASAHNLTTTSKAIENIIHTCRENSQKAICFVTGVPGAGKTLVGLNIANHHLDPKSDLYSVFLSGNGPLVKVLCEALARDKVSHTNASGGKITLREARSKVKSFIQNVHHFRDDCLRDAKRPPIEHVALFDEAQRAWNLQQTASFMRRKKHIENFNQSEPEFLISCLDRHPDWATIVCLVGGGQEINSGEAGIGEWLEARNRSFPDWEVYISSELKDSEYQLTGKQPAVICGKNSHVIDDLHLSVSLRSFRAEKLSSFVKALLDIEVIEARQYLNEISAKYPIILTRKVEAAREWLRNKARGTERYGLVASSQASRLKPRGIDVRPEINPIHWFLHDKKDVRSSYYMEDVATEFHIQGLELDWAGVVWDGDFRFNENTWQNWSFKGSKWQRIHKRERQIYQKNAYRVLMTRARQGMILVVPEGSHEDPTRPPEYYDATFRYLQDLGIPTLS